MQPGINDPWIIAGDFKTVRSGEDRSTGRATLAEICRFNDAVRDLQIQELPLLDRAFTWSNGQDPPILTRIDRVFINASWDTSMPNSTLHTIPKVTSDHCPLKVEASTTIPASRIFGYENNWKFKAGFADLVGGAWRHFNQGENAANTLCKNLKGLRAAIGKWRKKLQPDRKLLDTNKFTLAFLDWLEEKRQLSKLEMLFRIMVKQKMKT